MVDDLLEFCRGLGSALGLQVYHGRSNMESLAMVLAMIGDASRAQAITEELSRRFPDDTLLHNVWVPCAQALTALNRKTPEPGIATLQATGSQKDSG
jgi:hypothetical protein